MTTTAAETATSTPATSTLPAMIVDDNGYVEEDEFDESTKKKGKEKVKVAKKIAKVRKELLYDNILITQFF